jgi:hypothetical protein
MSELTEQTDAAVGLAALIVADTDEPMWSAVVIAKHILASDWLAAREAKARADAWDAALVEASERGFLVAGYLVMVQANPARAASVSEPGAES